MIDTNNTCVIKLAPYLDLCPAHWIKFVRSVNPTGKKEHAVDLVLHDVYNATLSDHIVTFRSESDLMLFLLNWS